MSRIVLLAGFLLLAESANGADAPAPDYTSKIAPIFKTYCVGCHNDADREGEFSLESFRSLQKGGTDGPVFKSGDAAGSRLFRQLTGAAKPVMPPKDEPHPSAEEIALIKSWIDGGAQGPTFESQDRLALNVPSIPSRTKVRPVTALDVSRDGKWLAVARYESVELYAIHDDATQDETPVRVIREFPGKITALHFSNDGRMLISASGVAGLGGVATLWNVTDGSRVRDFKGHLDLIYDAELSPDGKTLATCSYDRSIVLWNAETGQVLQTLTGHNGAVYDVAFSPDGTTLLSASADDTCKVWRVADGTRLDTLPQPLKEEYACAFTPDGRAIVAGGADNLIRVWDFVSRERPRINPMVRARFAHEAAITRLAFTRDGSRLVTVGDDRTIKVWDTSDYNELAVWTRQSDVVSAISVRSDGQRVFVGRMDGSIAHYDLPRPRDRAAATGTLPAESAVSSQTGEVVRMMEQEPNDSHDKAVSVALPVEIRGKISGRVSQQSDVDYYAFDAKAGESWILEVEAARTGSKLDSFIEVLDVEGHRVPRVLLQAVRDSYFTFRGKDDAGVGDFRVFNWEEMHLNEYLYANGEVVKLWLYPRGPDSGFLVYPGEGKRWGYFDSTPLAHALGEPCYIVEPHPPGATLIPNGLPVFPLYFENDDESHREWGKDSKLTFTAPRDGRYLARIRDVRSLEGADFDYKLTIRAPRPDFEVKAQEIKQPIGLGAAQEFKLSVKRIDGFEGPIRVEVTDLPSGFFASSPIVVESGQIEALGVIAARADAKLPAGATVVSPKLRAVAQVGDREVAHDVNSTGPLKLADKPTIHVAIVPAPGGPSPVRAGEGEPDTYEMSPGETITLRVVIERNGVKGPVAFGNEGSGRNLPFGVYIDNLGLNGLLITDEQTERTFFVTADRSVEPQTRLFHLRTTAGGGQASHPVALRIR